MKSLENKILSFLSNNTRAFLYILVINIPLFVGTFDNGYWSDDFVIPCLLSLKAKFSPVVPLLFEPFGGHEAGHFSPVYALIHCAITAISLDPRFFHFVIVAVYALTAFVLYLIVKELTRDRLLALVAATVFSLNYHIGFFGLSYNCMHCHVTNTFTGALSVLFIVRYIYRQGKGNLIAGLACYLLTILNIENGFIFFPIISLVGFFLWRQGKITFSRFTQITALLLAVSLLYPAGAYVFQGNPWPLQYRYKSAYQHYYPRSPQGYVYLASDMVVKSSGMTIVYNKLIVDPLKKDHDLKEAVKKIIREKNLKAAENVPVLSLMLLATVILFVFLFGVSFFVLTWKLTRPEHRMFLWIYVFLFVIFLFAFYRNDVINALSLFSSVVMAELLVCLGRAPGPQWRRWTAGGIAGLFALAATWTVLDRFDDCYRSSYQGVSRLARNGPYRIYNAMNRQIGHFIENGLIVFMHDYRAYHETTGFERIGDLISQLSDFKCYNAAVFYRDFLRTPAAEQYRDKSFNKFHEWIQLDPDHKIITVSSRDEAVNYIQQHHPEIKGQELIYISRDYNVERLVYEPK